MGAVPRDGRSVCQLSFYDRAADEWALYLEMSGNLVRMDAEPAMGTYWGQVPQDPSRDVCIPLLDLVYQQLSWPRVAGAMRGLTGDFHNLAAILGKYLVMARDSVTPRTARTMMMVTELEYLLILVRSMYDGLQKVSKQLAATVRSPSPPHDRIITDLPDSFAKVVLSANRLRSNDELAERFRLPLPIAQFYRDEGQLFHKLRELRDAIGHHGVSPGTIVDLDEGMAILTNEAPWCHLSVWRQDTLRNSNCGSLRALFLFLAHQVLSLTTRFAEAYASCIGLPSAICPGWHIYLRNDCSHNLVTLASDMENPWERQAADL